MIGAGWIFGGHDIMQTDRLARQINFIVEIDKLKTQAGRLLVRN